MTKPKFISTDNGFTLIEIMVSVTIMAIIVPILVMLFISSNKGFTTFEAANLMKQANQTAVNRMYLRLGRCKRIFERTTDAAFLAKLDMASAPVVASSSTLPTVNTSAAFNEEEDEYDPAIFGNSLFFLYNTQSAVLENIADSSAATSTVRIDTYRFVYYYLTAQGAPVVSDKQLYKEIEWESVKYADCREITLISDDTKRQNVIAALANSGINYCFYTAQTSADDAFADFSLLPSTTMTTNPNHRVTPDAVRTLTTIDTGLMAFGYQYGVSPNTSSWSADFKYHVPAFAENNGYTPWGIEVAVSGPAAGRKVIIRSIMTASVMNNIISDSQIVTASARDIW